MPRSALARLGAFVIRAALATALLLWPGAAPAATSQCSGHQLPEEVADRAFEKPMQFQVVKADGKRVLQAVGIIKRGDAGRLSAALQAAGSQAGGAVDEVWLHSPGGDALEGPEMGRVIRKAGLLTRLRKGQACISSCSMAFLGGLLRVVEAGSYYGVHMMTISRNTDLMVSMMDEMGQLSRLRKAALRRKLSVEAVDSLVADAAGRYVRTVEQLSAVVAAAQARYLVEMSISLELMTEEFAQSAQGVCYLGEAGMRKFNVANAGAATPGVVGLGP